MLKRKDIQKIEYQNDEVYELINSQKEKLMLKMYRNDNFTLNLDSKFFILICDNTNSAIYSMKGSIASSRGFFKNHKRNLIVLSNI